MRGYIAATLILSAMLSGRITAGEPEPETSGLTATHKQIRRMTPTHDGKDAKLNTFCLDRSGNILACVGGSVPSLTATEPTPNLLQVYSPEGDMIRETSLSFTPTAVNVAPDDTVYVAGSGKVSHISAEGKVLVTVDSPAVADPEEAREQARKAYEEQISQMTASMEKQLKRIETQVKKIEAIPEDERSDRDSRRLKSYLQQKEIYSLQLEQTTEIVTAMLEGSSLFGGSQNITSLAVTSKDVFICCGAAAGHGYEVWRTDRELSSPTRVVDTLSGCCGQCDIQANEDFLVLAENSSFRVGLLNRDGERIRNFGNQDRTSKTGFGSCCNPMNVRCCSNGDILTAESSIGSIKRFNSEGELVGVIGKAKIGGGCKHVAIGFDEERDRYYLQYEDRNQICVLVPLSEAPEFTEDELMAKAAREGLAQRLVGDGQQLTGEWSLTGRRPPRKSSGLFSFLGDILGGDSESEEPEQAVVTEVTESEEEDASDEEGVVYASMQEQQPTYFSFGKDGELVVRGGFFEHLSDGSWEAVSQNTEEESVRFSFLSEGIQYYDFEVTFHSDTRAEFAMLYGEQVMTKVMYIRIPAEQKKVSRQVSETQEVEEQE